MASKLGKEGRNRIRGLYGNIVESKDWKSQSRQRMIRGRVLKAMS